MNTPKATWFAFAALSLLTSSCSAPPPSAGDQSAGATPAAVKAQDDTFKSGFPSQEQTQRLYDDADLNRAIQAYRFFYPNVSIAGLFAGFEASAPIDNRTFFA